MATTQEPTMDPRFKALAVPFTDRQAYKDVSMGSFTLTTIDAYHIVERLTEVFGLCGEGWGLRVDEWLREGDNVAALGVLWYLPKGTMQDDSLGFAQVSQVERREVFAVGDGVIRKGNVAEAYKKATTNLMSKAASYLGVGGPEKLQ